VVVFDAPRLRKLATIKAHGWVTTGAVFVPSTTGKYIVSVSMDHTVNMARALHSRGSFLNLVFALIFFALLYWTTYQYIIPFLFPKSFFGTR